MFGRAIQDKLLKCIFDDFEISRVKRGQFKNFQKSQEIYSKNRLNQTNMWLLVNHTKPTNTSISFKSGQL